MARPPRTLLISPFFDAALPSGGSLYSIDVTREWLRRGRTVAVFCAGRDRSLGDLQAFVDSGQLILYPAITAEQERFTHHLHGHLRDLIGRMIKEIKPDLVHVHNIHGMLSAVRAAIASRVPTILTALDFGLLCFNFHLYPGTAEICPGPVSASRCRDCIRRTMHGPVKHLGPLLPRWLTRRLWPRFVRLDQIQSVHELQRAMRQVLRSLDAIIAPSPALGERLVQFGAGADRITTILYGLPPEKLVRPPKAPSETLRLAYLGGADPVKGFKVVTAAVEPLPDGLPLEIRAFGGDALRRLVERQPARVRRYVRYHPPRLGRDLAEEHARIDAVLVPSVWHENSPFVVLEALAAGTPVLASDQPGIRHLVMPDHTGWLIEPGEPGAWTRALITAVEAPARLRRMQVNAHFERTTAQFVDDVEELETTLMRRAAGALGDLVSLVNHSRRRKGRSAAQA